MDFTVRYALLNLVVFAGAMVPVALFYAWVGGFLDRKAAKARRFNLTLSESDENLLSWYVKYESQFGGDPNKVVAHFFHNGMEADVADSLRHATPLDPELVEWLDQLAYDAMKKISDES